MLFAISITIYNPRAIKTIFFSPFSNKKRTREKNALRQRAIFRPYYPRLEINRYILLNE